MVRSGLNRKFVMKSLTIPILALFSCQSIVLAQSIATTTPFLVPGIGARLSYPSTWSPQRDADKDTVLKIAPNPESNLHADCAIKVSNDFDDEKLAMGVVEQIIRKTVSDYKLVSKGDIPIGPKQRLKGGCQLLSMKVGEADVLQKQVFVRTPSKSMLMLFFTYLPAEAKTVEPFINSILASVQFGAGSISHAVAGQSTMGGAAATASASQSTSFTMFTSKSPSITIGYPSTWKPATSLEMNTLGKFSGHDGSRHCELTVSTMSGPSMSLDDAGALLDENIFQKLKNYHRARTESTTFGAPKSFSGQLVEGTFDMDGADGRSLTCYCKDQDRIFVIGVWSAGYKPSELHALFSKIVNTFRVND